ncbi:efflux RND transporter periplasmic adaptor subunit [candidate division KSB1 bacterium]
MRITSGLKKILVITVIVIIVSALVISRCIEKNNKKNGNGEDESIVIPVQVMTSVPERIEWGTSIVGILKADKGVDILSEAAGKVTDIYYNIGDNVSKGDVLIKLDDEYKQYDLIRAEAQYKSAKADREKSELDLKRYKQLFKEKSISEYDFENMRLKRDVSNANYLSAKSAYKTAKRHFEDTEIKAPFGGFASSKLVEIGNMVSMGMPAARVIDIRVIKLNVEVAEKDIVLIRTGNIVKIYIDVYPEDEFTGKVTAVSPEAESITKTFAVEIKLQNSDDYMLKPGMVAKGKIVTQVTENSILLPQEAVINRDEISYIFLNNGGIAEQRIVKTGRTYNNRIEIADGLAPNEKIIITGGEFLSNGMKILVQN